MRADVACLSCALADHHHHVPLRTATRTAHARAANARAQTHAAPRRSWVYGHKLYLVYP
jgi:hypothetical protein